MYTKLDTYISINHAQMKKSNTLSSCDVGVREKAGPSESIYTTNKL